ncbi:YdcF family protein [Limosilactobacillus caviae]|uniref:YdcF family protein n=1 Tax=Limosilactobacillus caviae TaxID=1769424 RepID=UPI00351911A1
MIILSLVNELLCALCWGITIRLILVRHLHSESRAIQFNAFAFILMLINLIIILPVFAFLIMNMPAKTFSWLTVLVVATLDVLSTFNLILFCVYSHYTRMLKCPPTVHYFLVLGAAVRHGHVPPVLATRLDRVVVCWKKHQSAKIIVSGGKVQKEKISEADAMAAYLINQGIPTLKIIRETRARNTWQNLTFTSQLINPHASVVVVTSDFHVLRAKTYARKLGLLWSFVGSKTPRQYCPLTFIRDYLGLIRDHRWLAGSIFILLLLVEFSLI